MKRVPRSALFLFVLAGLVPAAVAAQTNTVSGSFTGHVRSSWEEYYLSLFDLDHYPLGARALGMGGAGVALLGGAERYSLNPAGILGLRKLEVQAEARAYTGSAGVSGFPPEILIGPDTHLDAANYRVSPLSDLDYSALTVGMPLILLGQRGAGLISYRRLSRTGSGDENRVELRGELTQGSDATYGVGNKTQRGMDAISLALAREITDHFGLGATLNFQSGSLVWDQGVGVSSIGQVLFEGRTIMNQEVSSLSVDVGGRFEMGPVSLASTLFLPHSVAFKKGHATIDPLPDPTNPENRVHIESAMADHDLNIPTALAVGTAFRVFPRLTVAGDFWYRPWSGTMVSRSGLTPAFKFENPADSSSFQFLLVPGGPREEFSANLQDVQSLRLGLEYGLVQTPKFRFPVRLGFRTEELSVSNVRVPSWFKDTNGDGFLNFNQDLVVPYWHALAENDLATARALGTHIADLLEHSYNVFRGDPVKSTAVSLGMGFEFDEWSAQLGFERQQYDIQRFFFDAFDPLLSPAVTTAKESRKLNRFSVTMSMRY